MQKTCLLALCLCLLVVFPALSQDKAGVPTLNLTAEERAFLYGRTLRLGVDSARPPFEFIDEKGVYSGISAGFMEACVKRLGIKTVLVPGLNVGAAMRKMKEGEIDVIPKISPEPERAREIIFTKPHATFASVIVTRKDVRAIKGADDLQGLRVGVIKGLIVETRVKRDYPNLPVISIPDVRTALVELSSGKIDAYIENMPIVSYNIDRLKLTNLKIAAQTPYIYDMAFGVRKDWPLLASALDKALASLSKEEVNAITGRWATIEYRPGIDWKLVGPFAGAVLVVVVFVVIWNRRLRNSIRERKRIQLELQEQARVLENSSSIKSSLAKMSGELQKAESYEDLAQKMMFHLAPLVDISYGAFYIMNEKEKVLRRVGGYGLMPPEDDSSGHEAGRFALGEGLVGQCAREKTVIDVSGFQTSPVRITWGGGHLHPQEIILLPVMQMDSVAGVLELASLKLFTDGQRSLFADLMPLLALNIEILQRNMRTRELLEQSRSQAEALAASQSQLIARQHELEEQKNLLLDKQHELEKSREVLAQEEEKSRMLLDSISVGIIIIDPESRCIVDANPVASQMIGLPKEDIAACVCHKFICPREQDNCPVLDLKQKIDNAERVLLTAAGREIPVLKTVTPVSMGNRKYLVESFVDITEQKKMEETLKQQMEEMERFNRLTITRELKMIELKREINDLLRKMGSTEKYRIVSEADGDQT